MDTPKRSGGLLWLPIALLAWNGFDVVAHVAVDLVEPLRIAGNVVAAAAALVVLLRVAGRYAPHLLSLAAALVLGLNAAESFLHGYLPPMLVFVGVTVLLLLLSARAAAARADARPKAQRPPWHLRWWASLAATLVGVAVVALVGQPTSLDPLAQLHDGKLVAADYWSDEPMILSAGMGFENIIGLPDVDEDSVREAGGSWYGSLVCTNGDAPPITSRTSAAASESVARFYEGFSTYDDGLPIVFSWPVATETVDLTDFQFTLSTGDVVFANSVGMWPNWELNERNVVVVFGDLGNRGRSNEAGAVFPVRLDIVEDDTPLLLVGPGGREVSAVGLSWATDTSPYDSGPRLVGAKLNAVGDEARGEGGLTVARALGLLPNDEFALFGGGDFRIRVLTTGGFSPDGVIGVHPDRYEDFFRLHATGEDGTTVLLDEVDVDYAVAGGTLRVVGLSDLGQREAPSSGVTYDGCYAEDRDNYIDIILVGDEAAARNVTFVEIPSLEGGYFPFYNPGGPGPEPFEGVRYTAPGPRDLEPVIIALDDPMRVDREAP